ncbi:MAG TPA: VWA domain-containing protein [Pyrinomonadaceae bacterium]|nr:VWA domain-containing protein [Pyrinomonadaceae bacterium]
MQKRALIFFAALFFSCFLTISAQNTPPNNQTPEQDVVRITTNLVQVDAVVTDKDGNQVTNLTAADFELLQDGKPQKITNFSYVNTAAPNQPTVASSGRDNKNAVQTPPVRVRPQNAGRLITFIVDDGNCTASHLGMVASQEALVKFVNEQMLPNDLVAIYRTRAGTSVFQQYTSDKEQLLRVARKIRWYPPTGSCASSSGDFYEAAKSNTVSKITSEGIKSAQVESPEDRRIRESGEDFTRNNQVVGTIGVLRYVVNGLQKVGGRKVVFLLSDGIPFRARNGQMLSALDALRDLTDQANRSAVVFNTIDVRGIFNSSNIEARDEVSTIGENDVNASDRVIASRSAEDFNRQDGLSVLAHETGGRLYRNSNALDVPVRRALSLEKGYYLVAYEPDDETFKGKKFHNIEIRVKRPELRVLSRTGFIGKTETETRAKPRSGDSELYEAIIAPLPRAGLNLQLTAFFGNTPTEGNFVRALVHLDGNEITFVDDANNFKKAVFDVVGVTLDEKNEVVDEFTRTHTFKIDAAAIPLIKRNGLIYTTDVPVKKAGTYNFRVAVRDAANRMLGTAGQVIQVPDLKKNKLFLSGLTVAQVDQNGKFAAPSAVKPENALSVTASTAVPAIRRFAHGAIMAYSYTLYNAQTDKTTNQPKLLVQVNLFRDGKIISEGQPKPAELEKQTDWSRINDYGYLRLNQNITPGDYALQIIVKDLQTNQTATQLIDFEVTQ